MPGTVRFSKGVEIKTPKRSLRLVFLFLFIGLVSSQTSTVAAHPADMYFQTLEINLTPSGIAINWAIKPGPILANYIWTQTDRDQNEVIDPEELDAWTKTYAPLLVATIDSTALPLGVQSVQFPGELSRFQSGEEYIVIVLTATWPQNNSNKHQLILHDQFEEKSSITWFYLSALNDSAFITPSQQGGILNLEFFKHRAQTSQENILITTWDSGRPNLPPGQKKDPVTSTAEQVIPELKTNTPQGILTGLVRQDKFSLSFYLFALGISMALGALHALTPGHGKTVVAAYLVGSRGTTRHAVALGTIVTLTHTGSVFLLGLITLVASRYFLPTKLIPIFEVISGLLIVGLGIGLLYSRWKTWRNGNTGHNHSHEHSHEHTHEHGGHTHTHDIPDQLTWRSLIALGISGGLVPCPDAVAILLVAIAINRIMLGLTLILAFSVGLAIVLIVIGLAMVHSARLFNRVDAFTGFAPVLPIVSAAAVVILGLALTYSAVTKVFSETETAQTVAGTSPANEASAGFDVSRAQIVFLGLDKSGQRQVMLKEMDSGNIRTLTQAAQGVSYMAVSPDNTQILYSPYRADFGSDLWLFDMTKNENKEFVNCAGFICSQAAWAPDGSRVVYEKLAMSASADSLGLTGLWWADINTGAARPVFQDAQLPGYNPRWSPDGEWLSYSVPGGGIHVQNLATGKNMIVSSMVTGSAYWSIDSKGFLFDDGYTQADRFITRLYYFNLITGDVKYLSHDTALEDSLAAWSPDGQKIAVVRRELGATLGDQIWIMNVDGSNAFALTNSSAAIHDGLNWSPDGKFLLAHLYELNKPMSEPIMIMIKLQSKENTELGEGLRPTWLVSK